MYAMPGPQRRPLRGVRNPGTQINSTVHSTDLTDPGPLQCAGRIHKLALFRKWTIGPIDHNGSKEAVAACSVSPSWRVFYCPWKPSGSASSPQPPCPRAKCGR